MGSSAPPKAAPRRQATRSRQSRLLVDHGVRVHVEGRRVLKAHKNILLNLLFVRRCQDNLASLPLRSRGIGKGLSNLESSSPRTEETDLLQDGAPAAPWRNARRVLPARYL